jgi:fumarate reductase iron-sulfur subunit
MNETIVIEVQRYRPEQDPHPWWQAFELDYRPEMSVLDALHQIRDRHDSGLAYRWSCRMAICGSCGLMVDGVPRLGCKTFLRDYYPDRIRLGPLAHFPIERDLIVDLRDFLDKLAAVKPYLIRAAQDERPSEPRRQTPAQLARFLPFAQCISCGLCYAACPEYGLNNRFFGPAALALLHRYNRDSRDQGRAERLPTMNAEDGVWGCTFVGYCSQVCPKGVDPAAAINQGKIVSVIDYVRHLVGLSPATSGQDATQEGER